MHTALRVLCVQPCPAVNGRALLVCRCCLLGQRVEANALLQQLPVRWLTHAYLL
jgi:hypothetical protein